MRMVTQVGNTLEETEQLLAEHNSFKEKARETREKVNKKYEENYFENYMKRRESSRDEREGELQYFCYTLFI